MNLVHTNEEIKALCDDFVLADTLIVLAKRYNRPELRAIANKLIENYAAELKIYEQFVGKECYAPPSFLSDDKKWRLGTIDAITHFNGIDVRVKFKYAEGHGGYDGHSLKQLTY
jgi:hypothetical protein